MTVTRKMNINNPGGTRASMSIGFVFLFISISITLPAQFDSIRINEFMALNQTTITDENISSPNIHPIPASLAATGMTNRPMKISPSAAWSIMPFYGPEKIGIQRMIKLPISIH